MPDHPAALRIIELYEQHAARWDEQRNRGVVMEQGWLDRFIGAMPVGGTVLDIGCGAGEPMGGYLIGQGLQVSGIDSSPAMIALCRQRFPAGDWSVADMRTLDLGRRFGGLLAWDSFFHLTAEDQRAMFNVFRSHADEGAALMFTSGPRAGNAIGKWQSEDLYHASLDPGEYRYLLAICGFEVVAHVDEDPTCGRHTVWLARLGEPA